MQYIIRPYLLYHESARSKCVNDLPKRCLYTPISIILSGDRRDELPTAIISPVFVICFIIDVLHLCLTNVYLPKVGVRAPLHAERLNRKLFSVPPCVRRKYILGADNFHGSFAIRKSICNVDARLDYNFTQRLLSVYCQCSGLARYS